MRVISDYLDTIPDISATEKAKLNYFFSCIVYEGSKNILFLLFFTITGHLKEFLYSILILLPLRIISGGLHFKHYLSCFAFSFGYFYLVTVPLNDLIPTYEFTIFALCICIFINFHIGPITSDTRPLLSAEDISRGKFHIFIATFYDMILTALFYDTALAPIGFWTIMLHSMQLVIAKLRKKRGEKCV